MTYLTVADLAALLAVPQSWVYANYRSLPHHKVGRYVRFSPDDVAAITARFAEPAARHLRSA